MMPGMFDSLIYTRELIRIILGDECYRVTHFCIPDPIEIEGVGFKNDIS